jgi:hypothetical protein
MDINKTNNRKIVIGCRGGHTKRIIPNFYNNCPENVMDENSVECTGGGTQKRIIVKFLIIDEKNVINVGGGA